MTSLHPWSFRPAAAATTTGAVLAALLAGAAPASASTVTCTLDGSRLTVDTGAAPFVGVRADDDGQYVVLQLDRFDPETTTPCTHDSMAIARSAVQELVIIDGTDSGPHTYEVYVDDFPSALVDLRAVPGDRVSLVTRRAQSASWSYSSGTDALNLTWLEAGHALPRFARVAATGSWEEVGVAFAAPDSQATSVDLSTMTEQVDAAFSSIDTVVGTPYADLLTMGEGGGTVRGGLGDDVVRFEQGSRASYQSLPADGSDLVSDAWHVDYSALAGPVLVTSDGVANDGAQGEGDNITDARTVVGTDTDDRLSGSDARESILVGGAGNDLLESHYFGLFQGGAGNDTARPHSGGFSADLGAGDDILDLSDRTTNVHLSGSATTLAEHVVGTSYADAFDVTGLSVAPGPGADEVVLGGGARFVAEPGPDGPDTVTGTPDSWADYSARDSDLVVILDGSPEDGAADEGDNVSGVSVVGGAGADVLVSNALGHTLRGGAGADRLLGRGGDDRLEGGSGHDELSGREGMDHLSGQDGNDTLDGGVGDDDVLGGNGADTLVEGSQPVDNGSDVLNGGVGIDAVTYLGRTTGVRLSTTGVFDDGAAAEDDHLALIERLIGTDHADVLTGGPGVEVLVAYGGNDTLTGGGGADRMLGGTGSDRFHAQDGVSDTLDGGGGVDSSQHDAIDARTLIESTF